MNYIDYEEELDSFRTVDSYEYEWSMSYMQRPENPMTKNILRRSEINHYQPRIQLIQEEDALLGRKRSLQGPQSPKRNTPHEKSLRRAFSSQSSDEDVMMECEGNVVTGMSTHYTHQRVVSDDSASERSSFTA
jgi:hypothetical protein